MRAPRTLRAAPLLLEGTFPSASTAWFRPCRAVRASIGFSVRFYRTSDRLRADWAGHSGGCTVRLRSRRAGGADAGQYSDDRKPGAGLRRGFEAALLGKPVVAVLAPNEGTETTDFLLPHAVLQRAGVVDVQVVAPRRGRVLLYPALQVEVAQDLASFDRAYPSGADYVIVPAMRDDNNPAIAAWLKQQADRGARIAGVCVGALVVGRAGLLDGRRFTTHQVLPQDPA